MAFQIGKNIYTISFVVLTIPWIHIVLTTSENLSRKTVTDEEFNTKSLINLNKYRALHGVSLLTFDPQLAEHAAKWAVRIQDKASRDGKLRPYYSHPHVEGENVMVHRNSSQPLEGSDAIDEWYSEIMNYDFSKHQFNYDSAQFTQLVWKDTQHMGLAMVHDAAKNYTVIVARFKPPGNIGIMDSFQQNVLPLMKNTAHKTHSVHTVGIANPPQDHKPMDFSNQNSDPFQIINSINKGRWMHRSLTKDSNEEAEHPPVIPHSVTKPNAVTDTPIQEVFSKPKSTGKVNGNTTSVLSNPNLVSQVKPDPAGRSLGEKRLIPMKKMPKMNGLTPQVKPTLEQKPQTVVKSTENKSPPVQALKSSLKVDNQAINPPLNGEPQSKEPIEEPEMMSNEEDMEEDSESSTDTESSELEFDITTPGPKTTTTMTTAKKPLVVGRTMDKKHEMKSLPKNPKTPSNPVIKSPGRTLIKKSDQKSIPSKETKHHPKPKTEQRLPWPMPMPKANLSPVATTKKDVEKSKVTSSSPAKESTSDAGKADPKGRSLSDGAKPDAVTEEPETVEGEVKTVPAKQGSFNVLKPKISPPPERIPLLSVKPPAQLKFAQDGLKAHNKYRKLHGVPPLKLDPQLVFDSYEWAKKNVATCDSKPTCVLSNTKSQDRGENIYAIKGSSSIYGSQPVDYWYREGKHYNYSTPGYQWKAGHFSAVVWRNTKTMGMGWFKGKKGVFVAVAMYHPPGNVAYPLFFKANVLPPIRANN